MGFKLNLALIQIQSIAGALCKMTRDGTRMSRDVLADAVRSCDSGILYGIRAFAGSASGYYVIKRQLHLFDVGAFIRLARFGCVLCARTQEGAAPRIFNRFL